MTTFRLEHEWQFSDAREPAIRETMGAFLLSTNHVALTQCEDIWSRTIRDTVQSSAYPIAVWFAANWWRINYEPLPQKGIIASTDWRLSHEIGAAACGFVWPQVLFASDGEAMYIWATPSNPNTKQSVKYLSGLNLPARIDLDHFQAVTSNYIEKVLARLHAVGIGDSDLQELWSIIQVERQNPDLVLKRRREAILGYDPDELSDELEAKAIEVESEIGASSMTELAPVYGARELGKIPDLEEQVGLIGCTDIQIQNAAAANNRIPPWQRAVQDARTLRNAIAKEGPLTTSYLCSILGIDPSEFELRPPTVRLKSAVAIPFGKNRKFIFRKKIPSGRRFELARFLADHIYASTTTDNKWLVSTDLWTSRQKYQKAFAAEFLCPIDALTDYIDSDFGASAVDDAADHFGVSTYTVNSLLANNGLIHRIWESSDSGLRYPIELPTS